MDREEMGRLMMAIERNTSALNRVADLLTRWLGKEDKETRRVERRRQLLDGIPYTEAALLQFKRPDLVMLARQLDIVNTSRPQRQLVAAVLDAQQDR